MPRLGGSGIITTAAERIWAELWHSARYRGGATVASFLRRATRGRTILDDGSYRRGRRTGMAAHMKKPLRVTLLFLLSLAVIGALLWFGDIRKVGTLIEHFQRIYFLWFLLLMLAHEALRTALWIYLLRALCIDVPLRTAVFAFAAGEAAKFVPTGAYFQNYLF